MIVGAFCYGVNVTMTRVLKDGPLKFGDAFSRAFKILREPPACKKQGARNAQRRIARYGNINDFPDMIWSVSINQLARAYVHPSLEHALVVNICTRGVKARRRWGPVCAPRLPSCRSPGEESGRSKKPCLLPSWLSADFSQAS